MEPFERYQVECSVLKLMIRKQNKIIPKKTRHTLTIKKRQPQVHYPQYLPHRNQNTNPNSLNKSYPHLNQTLTHHFSIKMTPKTPPEKSSKPRMKHWTPTQNHNKQHTNIHALKPPFYHFFPRTSTHPWCWPTFSDRFRTSSTGAPASLCSHFEISPETNSPSVHSPPDPVDMGRCYPKDWMRWWMDLTNVGEQPKNANIFSSRIGTQYLQTAIFHHFIPITTHSLWVKEWVLQIQVAVTLAIKRDHGMHQVAILQRIPLSVPLPSTHADAEAAIRPAAWTASIGVEPDQAANVKDPGPLLATLESNDLELDFDGSRPREGNLFHFLERFPSKTHARQRWEDAARKPIKAKWC